MAPVKSTTVTKKVTNARTPKTTATVDETTLNTTTTPTPTTTTPTLTTTTPTKNVASGKKTTKSTVLESTTDLPEKVTVDDTLVVAPTTKAIPKKRVVKNITKNQDEQGSTVVKAAVGMAVKKLATKRTNVLKNKNTNTNAKKNTNTKKNTNVKKLAVNKVTEVSLNQENLSEDISRKSYKIDKKGRAYRSYRLESFDGIKPTMEHSATQNTKYALTDDRYKNRSKGLSFGLGPRNAASKMLTSLCSHDRKLAVNDPNHIPVDVLNKNHILVIKETTRGNKQGVFMYSCFRVAKDNIDYKVKCDSNNPNSERKVIIPKFTNKLYSMASETAEHKMTPQQFACFQTENLPKNKIPDEATVSATT